MGTVRLLVADSEKGIRSIIRQCASDEGYAVDEAADGISALKLFRRNEYHLIITEADLPELDGKNVCAQIRKASDIPIIIISEEGKKEDKLSFFALGVDDYVLKPFFPEELVARIKVFLRRCGEMKFLPSRTITFSGIQIDTVSHAVYINEKDVALTPKEYELLLFLLKNPNKAFSRQALLNEVWGYDFFGSDRTIDTHIKTLRESIKPYHQHIATIWGYGYKFEM